MREARQARDALVDARVELHRAGAERIDRDIDRVILLAHAREVADDVDFADFRPGEVITLQICGNRIVRNVGGGKGDAATVCATKLEYRWFDGHSLKVPFLQVLTSARRMPALPESACSNYAACVRVGN